MFRRGRVHLVLHLEHDGDILHAVFPVSEDEVPLGPFCHVVVLLEIGIRQNGAQQLVEQRRTVYFKRFTDHFGTHASFQILVIVNLFLLGLKLQFMLLLEFCRFGFSLEPFHLHVRLELADGIVPFLNEFLRPFLFLHNGHL